jgi:sugar (pentulose or hexulose) kinase
VPVPPASGRQPVLLGLDVGTTSVKAVVIDLGGRELTWSRVATRWATTRDGVEHDPLDLVEVARQACRAAIGQLTAARVLGVGITSFAESGVLLDRDGRPLAPLIAWHDERDRPDLDALAADLGADRFGRHTGLPMWPQWSLTKHRWLLRHRPETRAAARRLNVAEWIARSLGGAEVAEQSLASRTGWLDLGSRQWWAEALDWSGARASLFPPLVVSGTALGEVSPAAGIAELSGAVITVAGHDHQAAAIGLGAAGPGDEVDSCGSAEALVRTIPAGLPAAAILGLTRAGITVGWHALPDRWSILGATQGGLDLGRALAELGLTPEDAARLELDAAGPDAAGPDRAGPDRAGPGGPADGPDPVVARRWLAALNEVAAQGHAVHEAISSAAGPHRALTVTGGWSRSPALMTIKRRLYGSLSLGQAREPGARGAALLAGLAAGVYPGVADFPPPGRPPG